MPEVPETVGAFERCAETMSANFLSIPALLFQVSRTSATFCALSQDAKAFGSPKFEDAFNASSKSTPLTPEPHTTSESTASPPVPWSSPENT